ncbi:uncharacterized protein [Parasteatoda tepidariorum]|uniref:uncharacterized protein isoform X1 n=1 Tax=Parasteatoda tepidariorum TaxID=114398 RepID=UPI001C727F73|nr:uncharacterized protein LOC107445342 isoform X1 [Parasteatoda tepidariorum]XP_015915197.2 uncharacterized protein LOC107445342 isoform X1 [Parasteatoda tepidariorum]XP_015915198.2 uncharacterized protein LOC107445342 isoform X1 [Parasteatoda tepidariorum]
MANVFRIFERPDEINGALFTASATAPRTSSSKTSKNTQLSARPHQTTSEESKIRNFRINKDSPNSSRTHSSSRNLPGKKDSKSLSKQSQEHKMNCKIKNCTVEIKNIYIPPSPPTVPKPARRNKSFGTNCVAKSSNAKSSANRTFIRKPSSSGSNIQRRNLTEDGIGQASHPKNFKKSSNTGNRQSLTNKDTATASLRRKESSITPSNKNSTTATLEYFDKDLPSTSAPSEISYYGRNQEITTISSNGSSPNRSTSQGLPNDAQRLQPKTFIKGTKNPKELKSQRGKTTGKSTTISPRRTPGLWKENEETDHIMDIDTFDAFVTHVRGMHHPGEMVYQYTTGFDAVIKKINGVLKLFYERKVVRKKDNYEAKLLKDLRERLKNHEYCKKCQLR